MAKLTAKQRKAVAQQQLVQLNFLEANQLNVVGTQRAWDAVFILNHILGLDDYSETFDLTEEFIDGSMEVTITRKDNGYSLKCYYNR